MEPRQADKPPMAVLRTREGRLPMGEHVFLVLEPTGSIMRAQRLKLSLLDGVEETFGKLSDYISTTRSIDKADVGDINMLVE